MGDVVQLPRRYVTFVAEYGAPPGGKRRRWNVVCVEPDGAREFIPYRARDKSDAEWFCNMMRGRETAERQVDSMITGNPLFRILASLPPDMRRAAMSVLRRIEERG